MNFKKYAALVFMFFAILTGSQDDFISNGIKPNSGLLFNRTTDSIQLVNADIAKFSSKNVSWNKHINSDSTIEYNTNSIDKYFFCCILFICFFFINNWMSKNCIWRTALF